ncbi:hypothetical protein Tter_1754 [Thermobaculum terrenum ATCC BAA-798]|uniref:Uncharacterized protein n=1 Tax=Thermobaculum terrenum (strain ATCC BAA-798 / CCMEE 7001 / YNP1) TaxID=525904 RepID=D1CCZ5_THET1|nr:hypothetical protein [Thermobaculum terrenum]ACZ42660.1 hypothetical protein Tter_1754 [Thermobaculum terrenum ATCC BAA-798]
MSTTTGRNLFIFGAVIGAIGGLVLGSIATYELGDYVTQLVRRLFRAITRKQEQVRFDLLSQ